jgi:hypothetical protein
MSSTSRFSRDVEDGIAEVVGLRTNNSYIVNSAYRKQETRQSFTIPVTCIKAYQIVAL